MFGIPKEGLPSFLLSLAVAGMAAYVDAAGFSLYSGAYVSFMGGNTTRAGVLLGKGSMGQMFLLAGVILAFVVGAAIGAMITEIYKKRGQALVLLFVGAGLAAVALISLYWQMIRLSDLPRESLWTVAALMGMLNAAVRRVDKVSVGLTYVTGSLVKLGLALGSKLVNRGAIEGDQNETLAVLGSIWLAFVGGATWCGLAAGFWGLDCVVLPAVVLAGLGVFRWQAFQDQ